MTKLEQLKIVNMKKTRTIYLGSCSTKGCNKKCQPDSGYCKECEKLINSHR